MAASSVQAIFSAAERAFVERRLADARSLLATLERAGLNHPAVHHLRGLVERGLGEPHIAKRYLTNAVQLSPNDPQINNNLGNVLSDLGDEMSALSAYERALACSPGFHDAALNRAITLYRLRRYSEARSALLALSSRNPQDVRIWNALGVLEREAGDAGAARDAFDRALAIHPADESALKGRARMALECGEPDALPRYAHLLTASPGDPQIVREQTLARLSQGDELAIEEFAAFVRERPDWTEGQLELARMKWETLRDPQFADHIRALLKATPQQRDLWNGYIDLLAATGHYGEAAEAAAKAAAALPADPALRLVEAIHAGRSGDIDRAEALFCSLPTDLPGRAAHEAVHRVRTGDYEFARKCIDDVLRKNSDDIGSWAVAELLYRKLNDGRSNWLSGQQGLVQTLDLPLNKERMEAIADILRQLHERGAEMVGQSVRNGTQTRWRLFDRGEPELKELRASILISIENYLAGLPAADDSHPLLKHRDAAMKIVGSWSIRLTGGGYHVSHIHPEGVISSACYFAVPPLTLPNEGHLELGRPPSDLSLDLEPLHIIRPEPGRLVLFPSYLHHGTRPFASGERLTVAFDVNRDPAPRA